MNDEEAKRHIRALTDRIRGLEHGPERQALIRERDRLIDDLGEIRPRQRRR